MEKFYINPKFQYLSSEIKSIPRHAYSVDKVYCNHRNTVELTTIKGERFVVKKYKRPTLANCVIYTWFRKPKTQRAYNNAFMLGEKGIETADPVAYIESYKHGFYHTGWFISRYLPYADVREYYDGITDDETRRNFADAFLRFTNSLFEKKLLDEDYNSGNILAYKKDGEYHFALVDINRIRRCSPTAFDEVRALSQLKLKDKELPRALVSFANISEQHLDRLSFCYRLNKSVATAKHNIKHWFKRLIGLEGNLDLPSHDYKSAFYTHKPVATILISAFAVLC